MRDVSTMCEIQTKTAVKKLILNTFYIAYNITDDAQFLKEK